MISFNGYDDNDGCFFIVNNIISWVSKEKIIIILSSDEAKFSTAGISGKQLLWMKKMLKECNVGQDVMTFVSNISSKPLNAIHFEKGVCICENQ